MLLPDIDDAEVPRELTSVNTFRFLFNKYFDADLPLLPNRVLVPMSGTDVDVAGRLGVEP